MNRTALIQRLIGLTPTWKTRPNWFEEHPAVLRKRSHLQNATSRILAEPRALPALDPSTPCTPVISVAPSIIPTPPHAGQTPLSGITPPPSLEWEDLERTVNDCRDCPLCRTRTQVVFGCGKQGARWLVIGEAPRELEDKQGLPFVGRSGQLLNNMLLATGLDRDAYITNVLKCRPPGGRDPSREEIVACQKHLIQQIRHINPALILALGRVAAQTLLDTESGITQLRGKLYRYQGIPLIVSYHPAYLLRNQADKHKAWKDLILARKVLSGDEVMTYITPVDKASRGGSI